MKSISKVTLHTFILNRILNNYSRFKLRHASDGKKQLNPFKKKMFFRSEPEESKVASRMCITILGNGAFGQPRCVGIFTEFKGFLFNCGEGVGRLCREYEVNFSQIKNVFITQNTWRNVSGLADVYITNDVYGVHKMSLYGPPGIEYFTNVISADTRAMILRKKSSYTDENMEIDYIPIKCSKPPFKGSSVCFSYVCKIFKKLGEFNPEKCVDLDVPFGPHLLKLKNGEDVTLQNGRVIYSMDVLDALCPATTVLVVDCPSEDFLDSFVNEEQFSTYQLPMENTNEVAYIFHFSPSHIVSSKKYQTWIQKFHPNVQHYILNSSNSSTASEAVDQTQNVLHLFHPEIFKLLPHDKAEPLPLNISSKLLYPPPMFQIHLRPERKISWDNVLQPNSEDYVQMITDVPDFNSELSKLKSLTSLQTYIEGDKYPEVLFLGTSSATSSAFRNVSAILVNTNSNSSILLDCGEGTFNQLVRYYGKSEVSSVLQRISCIFITHKHTDHYMGVFEVIKARMEAFENSNIPYQPVVLILPNPIREIFFRFHDLYEPLKQKIRLFLCKNLIYENEYHQQLSKYLDGIKLFTVAVQHCNEAYGIVLQKGSDWKIVYSGDTVPCQKLIDAGKNCTLLIHEATVEDNLLIEATQKKHSTPSQVIDVAEKMNAQNTIMTHFSKRYLGVPVFKECDRRNVGCSFDFMKVRLHELHMLPLFLPALKCLFQEQLDSHFEKSSSVTSFENVFLKTCREFKSR